MATQEVMTVIPAYMHASTTRCEFFHPKNKKTVFAQYMLKLMKNLPEKIRIPVLRPESTVRMVWDVIIGLLSLYSLVYVPVFTFFDQPAVCAVFMHA